MLRRISFRRGAVILTCLWFLLMMYYHAAVQTSDSSLHSGTHRVTHPVINDGKNHVHITKNSTKGEVIHVCLTSDQNTVMGMVTAVSSIRRNTQSAIKFHLVVTQELEKHVREWIEESELYNIDYEIVVFRPERLAGKIMVRGGRPELASPMNYARFYYPELLPDVGGKLLHVDDDCVVQGDISELFHTSIRPNHWAAFSEDCTAVSKRITSNQNVYINFINFANPEVKKLKMKPTACSFNTGLFVTDLSLWRKFNISQHLEYWMKLNTEQNVYGSEIGGGGSQPPVMIVFYKKWTAIDPLWHVRHLGYSSGTRYSRDFIEHAKLLHWNGHFKPWGGTAQYVDIWDKYFVPDPLEKYKPVRKYKQRGKGF